MRKKNRFEGLPNFSKIGYSAKQQWFNKDNKPCLSPIYYSITMKDGRAQFGISKAQGNFSTIEFEDEKKRAFPYMDWMSFYENKEAWQGAQVKC